MDEKELAPIEKGTQVLPEITIEDVKKYLCPQATNTEITLFLKICQQNQLNPFKREVYLVKYGTYPASVVTGYETYLKRAERSGQYGGFKAWVTGNIPEIKACIEVYRKDWDKPLYHEVEYSEYVICKGDGTPNKFWKEKPKTMLKKVVISQAFRFAFPEEVGGLPYTQSEMPIETESTPIKEPEIKRPQAMPLPSQEEQPPTAKPTLYKQMLDTFQRAKDLLGESRYYEFLYAAGYKHSNGIKTIQKGNEVLTEMKEAIKLGSPPNES